jgi:hypothetical protein
VTKTVNHIQTKTVEKDRTIVKTDVKTDVKTEAVTKTVLKTVCSFSRGFVLRVLTMLSRAGCRHQDSQP